MNWWWRKMTDDRDFIGAYILYSQIPKYYFEDEFDTAVRMLEHFEKVLDKHYNIDDWGARAALSGIKFRIKNHDSDRFDVVRRMNNINEWLALGAKLQRIGVSDD